MSYHSWSRIAPNGRFIRKHFVWTPDRWDDAKPHRLKKGLRFRVYRPDYPRADITGYAFRSHVVYWLATRHVVALDECLHHRNEDKTDDRLENLELLLHGEHTRRHCAKEPIRLSCEQCERDFRVPQWRLNQRETKYCSQLCFHAAGRSIEHRKAIAHGLRLAYETGKR